MSDVWRDHAARSRLAGWNEKQQQKKKTWRSVPHLNHHNDSVETTQPWDDHNKPEQWSQHAVSISQASSLCSKHWWVVHVLRGGVWYVTFLRSLLTETCCFITNLSLISLSLIQRGYISSTASSCGGKPMFSLRVNHILRQSFTYFTLCHINTSNLLFRGDGSSQNKL